MISQYHTPTRKWTRALCCVAVGTALPLSGLAADLGWTAYTPPADAMAVPFGSWSTETEPLVSWGGTDDAMAQAWVGATSDSFHVKVVVRDAVHENSYRGPNIWQGDCLQFGLDLRGDGAQGNGEDFSGALGPDDMAGGLALTTSGPVGWGFFAGSPDLRGPLDPNFYDVMHDPSSGLTTYVLELPWDVLGATVGAYPSIGLSLVVNDGDAAAGEQVRWRWGAGAEGIPSPARHQKIVWSDYPAPDQPVFEVRKKVLVSLDDTLQGWIALPAGPETGVTLRHGDFGVSAYIPASDKARRGWVGFKVIELEAPGASEVSVHVTDQELWSGEMLIGSLLFADVQFRVDSLVNDAAHPLFAQHWRSVGAVVTTEWARLGLYAGQAPSEAAATVERLRALRDALEGPAAKWDLYRDGISPLLVAYLSDTDGTTQYFHVTLPDNWDPEIAYPLFFELHGAGDDNPLNGPVTHLTGGSASGLHGYEATQTFAQLQGNGYHVMPFARGNLGYMGIAETDVVQTYEIVHEMFRIDPKRRYLYGFSMGGGGTWWIASQMPDQWAAVAVMAGGLWRMSGQAELAQNFAHLPVYLWCGEADSLFQYLPQMERQLREAGAEPVVRTTPGLGHQYIAAEQEKMINWLQQFEWHQPERFEFVATSPEHTGSYGVRMRFDPTQPALPQFVCTIEGNLVQIESTGTDAIKVDLTESGLDLEGDITLHWNNAVRYNGPPARVLLTNEAVRAITDPVEWGGEGFFRGEVWE